MRPRLCFFNKLIAHDQLFIITSPGAVCLLAVLLGLGLCGEDFVFGAFGSVFWPVPDLALSVAVGDEPADFLACRAVPAQLLGEGGLAVGTLSCDDITLDAVNGGGHGDQFVEFDTGLLRWTPLDGVGVSLDTH